MGWRAVAGVDPDTLTIPFLEITMSSVSGFPRWVLRAEGLAMLIASSLAYAQTGESWVMFALLFLAPDLGLVGYARGPRVGAIAYNLLHTYLAPGVLAAAGVAGEVRYAWPLSLIWIAHIGLDRALGFGLKFATGFRDTHLGSMGRQLN